MLPQYFSTTSRLRPLASCAEAVATAHALTTPNKEAGFALGEIRAFMLMIRSHTAATAKVTGGPTRAERSASYWLNFLTYARVAGAAIWTRQAAAIAIG
jgi:hypothetical protein